ncbi:MAG TPA: hypothetical protein VGQ89_16990 [Candidatus Limnocylindrales bacterium]|nr:hypothetical protein [Candidatus Limnocylindrales bacterium]
MRYKSLPPSVRSSSPAPSPSRPPASPPTRLHRIRDIIATIPLLLFLPALMLPFITARASIGGSLIASPQELAVLPTSGTAWTYLKSVADGDLGLPNLTDQDNKHDVKTLAVALVANRLDSDAYRTKARLAILGAMGTEVVGADNSILALGRQLGAYVLAADLIGLSGPDDATFRTWLAGIRTRELGGHGRYRTLKGTCEDSPHNWGTFACASLIAANRYLGDDAAVARSWAVFRGLTGDRSAYAGFENLATDIWACPGLSFTPANSGCPTDAVRFGAFVKDVTRGSDPPTADGDGLSYTQEILQGVALQAELLERAGYPGAWERLRPAFDWARRNGALNLSSVGYHVTWWANERFGWSLATRPAAMGRVFGYTDWLYGSPLSGTVPVPSSSPTPAATPRPTLVPTSTPAPAATATPSTQPTAALTPTPSPPSTPTPTAIPTATPTSATATPAPTAEPPPSIEPPSRAGADIVGSSAAQTPGAASIDLDRPTGVRAGDLLVAAVETRGQPSMTAPDGWRRVRADSADPTLALATYVRIAGDNEPSTYRWVVSRSTAMVALLVAVRGADADAIADANGRADAKRAAIPAPDGVADRDASLVLAVFGAARATSIAPPTDMTEVDEVVSSSGRYKATLQISAGAADRGSISGLVAAAGGRSATVSHLLVVRP